LEGLQQANRLICADSPDSMFVTVCYAQIDALMGEVTFVNAGHNPPLLYRCETGQVTRLTRTGMALGVLPDAAFEQKTLRLTSGDFIVFYTDGVTDAVNAVGEEFGLDRLLIVTQSQCSAPPDRLVAEIKNDVLRFTGEAAPFDDVTLVVVKRQ
jgi:sigma-B regulation protein RsbU (phosphoserine phosphatase)